MDAVPHGMACRSVLMVVPVGRFRKDQVVHWIVMLVVEGNRLRQMFIHARPLLLI